MSDNRTMAPPARETGTEGEAPPAFGRIDPPALAPERPIDRAVLVCVARSWDLLGIGTACEDLWSDVRAWLPGAERAEYDGAIARLLASGHLVAYALPVLRLTARGRAAYLAIPRGEDPRDVRERGGAGGICR